MRKVLYVAVLDTDQSGLLLFTFYATEDGPDMTEHVLTLVSEYEGRLKSLAAYPGGFKIVTGELPGVIETPEDVSN